MENPKYSILGHIILGIFCCWMVCGCSAGGSDPIIADTGSELSEGYDSYLVESDVDITEGFLMQDDSYVPLVEPIFRESAINMDNEPNDDFSRAVEIVLGPTDDDPASGTINWPKVREGTLDPVNDPSDFYKFSIASDAAVGIQLDEADGGTELRLWRFEPSLVDYAISGERIQYGTPKAINFAMVAADMYWIEITNSSVATDYKVRIAFGNDQTSEPRNDLCNDQTPLMHHWERGTLKAEAGEDVADYWRIEAKYGGAICLDLVYFKDFEDPIIEFTPSLSAEPGEFTEDGNHTYVEYGAGAENLPPGRYYAGAVGSAGEGLYCITDSVYAGSYSHNLYPNPLRIIACQCGSSAYNKVILSNRGNVPVNWSLESENGKFRFDASTGYLAPGYATVRRVIIDDPCDPYWTLGTHSEQVMFKLNDITSYETKAVYSIPVEMVIVENEYAAGWDPGVVELVDVQPEDMNYEVGVKITNAGCKSFFCSLKAGADSPWLSFIKPPQYLAPGRSTLTTFVIDVSGMSGDTYGNAVLTVYNTTWRVQEVVEIPVSVLMMQMTASHPWAMAYGDAKHNSTSEYSGPGDGASIIWSGQDFGEWQDFDVDAKTITSAITIDENGLIFFSARVKPLEFGDGVVYRNATFAIDGSTGGLVAFRPHDGDGTSVAIDNDGKYWFASETGSTAIFQRADISGDSLTEYCGTVMQGGVGGGPVLGNGSMAFIGEDNGNPYSHVYGFDMDCGWVWDQNSAVTESEKLTTPAVGDNGMVYIAGSNGKVYGFDSAGNRTESTYIGKIVASPSIDSMGSLYIVNNMGDIYRFSPDLSGAESLISGAHGLWGPVVDKNDIMYFDMDWALHAYDVSGDGTPVHMWTFDYPRKNGIEFANDAPVIDAEGNVYIGTEKHWVYCIDPSGDEVWSIRIAGSVLHSPAIGEDGQLYIGDDKGYMYAIG